MSTDATYAPLPAGVVYEACMEYKVRRQSRIANFREPLIKNAMKPLTIFGVTLRRARTWEEAARRLEADTWGEFNRVEWQDGYWAARVEELATLAAKAMNHGRDVSVSAEIAAVIF